MFPVGGIVFWPSALPMSAEWLVCNGDPQDPTSELGRLLGSRFGLAPSDQRPLLPDMRGRFAKGAGENGAPDKPGTAKPSAFQAHTHAYDEFPVSTDSMIVDDEWHTHYFGAGTAATTSTTLADDVDPSTAQLSNYETRPANVYVHFMIYAGDGDGA